MKTKTITKKGDNMSKQVMMQKIVDKVISQIDQHGKNWLKPWASLGMPKNLSSGKNYRGINTIALWIAKEESGFTSDIWGTFNQIRSKGGKINKGAKGSQVIYMQPALFRDARKGEKPDTVDGSVKVQYNLMRSYYVFNLNQTTGLEHLDIKKSDGSETLFDIEQYVKNTGAKIKYSTESIFLKNSCYYIPSQDYIGMVNKELFNNGNDGSTATQNFYATLLHELTHWTGHKSRCNRDEKYKAKYFENFKSNEKYAFEELVAEIGSAIQCCILGITMEPTPHAIQYLNIWKDRIKSKPESIFKASAMAQAGVSYIQDLQPENIKKAS